MTDAPSRPVVAVEGAVLDGFRDVGGADGFGTVEVGDGTRNLQDAVVGARRESQARHGAFEQPVAIRRDVAVLPELPRAHLRIAVNLFTLEALHLPLAGIHNARPNFRRAFATRTLPQFAVLHGRHVDVDIDAIEQRTGNLGDIPLDHGRRAGAIARWIVEKAARAGIHGRCQHKSRREGQRHSRTGNGDRAVFGWLPL
jgi:hypothetical protein